MKRNPLESTMDLFSRTYRERNFHTTIFKIGDTEFTRDNFIKELGNPHWVAAKDLAKTLKRMHVEDADGILAVDIMGWARIKGMGEAKLRILIDLLIHAKVSDRKMEKWFEPATGEDGAFVAQWTTLTHRAQKKTRKRGKHGS